MQNAWQRAAQSLGWRPSDSRCGGRTACQMAQFIDWCVDVLRQYGDNDEIRRSVELVASQPERLSEFYEQQLESAVDARGAHTMDNQVRQRKRQGVYFTPQNLISPLLDACIPAENSVGEPITVCDPACGTGNFLQAAADRLLQNGACTTIKVDLATRRRIVGESLFGTDIDAGAIAIAKFRLWNWAGRPEGSLDELMPGLRVVNALAGPFEIERFDVVLGNPPFANAIEGRIDQKVKACLRQNFPEVGGTADLAYYFLALADRMVKKDGCIGLVLPRAVLSGRAVQRLREQLQLERPPSLIQIPFSPLLFNNANIFVVLLSLGAKSGGADCVVARQDRKGGPFVRRNAHIDSANWWAPVVHAAETPRDKSPGFRNLRPSLVCDRFEVFASMTTGMAYELVDHLVDEVNSDAQTLRLITTGLIDPGRCHWGEKTCRYLKRRYEHPCIRLKESASAPLRRRLAAVARPKVLVGGLSNRVEAVLDPMGDLVGAVSTFTILSPRDDIDELNAVCDLLNEPPATIALHEQLGANAMGGGRITLSKHFLRGLPYFDARGDILRPAA